MNHRKAAKRISVLWIFSYLLVYIAQFVYIFVEGRQTGSYEFPGLLSGYQIFVFVMVLCYFLPLLFKIRYHAKKADMSKLSTISLVSVIILIVWSVFSSVAMLIHVINST